MPGDIEENYQQQLYFMKNLEQFINKLTAEKDDFKHHLVVIYSLLEEDETAAVSNYTEELAGQIHLVLVLSIFLYLVLVLSFLL